MYVRQQRSPKIALNYKSLYFLVAGFWLPSMLDNRDLHNKIDGLQQEEAETVADIVSSQS